MLNSRAMSLAPRRQLLCRFCQSRSFSTSYRWLAAEQQQPAGSTKKAAAAAATTNSPSKGAPAAATAQAPQLRHVVPPPSEQFAAAPRGYGKRVEEFTPVPLSRPIGMAYPPEEGQNTGIDERTWNQRRKEFSTMSSSARWSQHLERREELYVRQVIPLPHLPLHFDDGFNHKPIWLMVVAGEREDR